MKTVLNWTEACLIAALVVVVTIMWLTSVIGYSWRIISGMVGIFS